MELRQLKYFLATAEELHFRRAAELVHVAQPALSQAIHQLEEEIGALLFDRNQRKVQLTPAGKAFYDRARALVDSSATAILEARGIGRGEAGTLTIGYVSTAAMKVLPAALKRFKEVCPTAQIELRELGPGEQMDHLQRGALDLGLTIARILDTEYNVVEVCREPLIAALPENPAYLEQREVDLKQLCQETTIVPGRHSRSGYFETVQEAYRDAGVKPANIQCVQMIQTGLMLVGAGLGIALVPASFTGIQLKGVIYRPLVPPAPEIAVSAVWRKENTTPLLRKFIQEVVENRPGRP